MERYVTSEPCTPGDHNPRRLHLRAKREHLQWFRVLSPEGHDKNLALTVSSVPYSLDSGCNRHRSHQLLIPCPKPVTPKPHSETRNPIPETQNGALQVTVFDWRRGVKIREGQAHGGPVDGAKSVPESRDPKPGSVSPPDARGDYSVPESRPEPQIPNPVFLNSSETRNRPRTGGPSTVPSRYPNPKTRNLKPET